MAAYPVENANESTYTASNTHNFAEETDIARSMRGSVVEHNCTLGTLVMFWWELTLISQLVVLSKFFVTPTVLHKI